MRTRTPATSTVALLALVGSLLVAAATPAAAQPIVSVDDAEVVEDDGELVFTVTISEDVAATVEYFTADGDATDADNDYEPRAGTVSFLGDGTTVKDVTIPVNGDDKPEADETLTVNLHDASGATIDEGLGEGTIVNDDGPALSFQTDSETATFSGGEGAPDTTTSVTLTVEADWGGISSGNRLPASVGFTTTETTSTATAEVDYEPPSDRIDIDPPAGSETTTTHEFAVTILGDDLYEGGSGTFEDFFVGLADPAFAVLSDEDPTEAAVEIEDDEEVPTITVDDAAVIEGDAGTSPADVAVHLSHPSAFETTVNYSTADGTATNAGGDYVPVASGTELTVEALATAATIEVGAKGDTTDEPNETFQVNLSLPGDQEARFPEDAASIASTVSIRNDDGPHVAFAVAPGQPDDLTVLEDGDLALPEGADGETTPYAFTVTLSETVSQPVEVDWTTTDGTASAAQNDYEAANGTVTIPAGGSSADIVVNVIGDDFPGHTEWFFVDLTAASPSGVSILDDRAKGTLVSDDGPVISVADVDVVEGDPDGGDTTVDVELTFSIPEPYEVPEENDPGTVQCGWEITCDVTAEYRTVEDSAADDGDDADYDPATGTVTIPEGETSTTLTLTVHRDDLAEADETFLVRLSEPAFAKLDASASAFRDVTITIVDDDGPTLTIGDVEVVEGDDGTVDAVFPVSLPEDATDPVAIDFATVDGSATTADDDYIARSGTAKFEPGQRTVDVVVKVIGDPWAEDDETFGLRLSRPQYAVLGSDATGTATIADDGDTTVDERDGDGGDSGGGGDDGGGGTPTDGTVVRSSGADRIATAVAVSSDHWDAATDAVLATGFAFPDALAGGALAADLGAPLLLTAPGDLPDAVAAELARLGVQRVWVLGGTAAVSAAVQSELEADGYQVHRLAGADRFATAAAVAAEVGAATTGEVALTLGIHAEESRAWPDALSAGSLAAVPDGLPTLLTAGGSLPDATVQALSGLGAGRVLVLGGTAAVGDPVVAQLEDLGHDVERLAAADRYATSAAVAAAALARTDGTDVPVVFATGTNYPDGLAATALAARLNGLVVLVPGTAEELHADVEAFLRDNVGQLAGGVVVGGEAVVSETVRRLLTDALSG